MRNSLRWLQHNGGDTSYIEYSEKFEKAKFIMPVYANNTGYIQTIDADLVGSIARYLGAGRMNDENQVDKTAGILLNKKIGDEVQSGEIVAYIYTNDESKVIGATKNLEDAFQIRKRKVVSTPRIVDII